MERKVVEYLSSGRGFNSTCKIMKMGRATVAHIREKARIYGYLDGSNPIPPYPEALFPDPIDGRSLKTSEADKKLQKHLDWIKNRLETGWQPVTIHEELPEKVTKSSFYRFLHRHKLYSKGEENRRKLKNEIIYPSGEALLVDWGKLRTAICPYTGKKRTLWAFVGILGHSRYMMVRLVWKSDVETTLSVLESMISELGGVPNRIISDNAKCFAIEASKYEPILNPAYERFASHYGLTIECLPPRTPELKGKVERMMPFVRRLYQAHGDKWLGISESQEYINKKVAVANDRLHGTTRKKPVEIFFEDEVNKLKPLPPLKYEVEQFHEGRVRQDSHVRFNNKYYSTDETYIGEKVTIIANSKQVSIYYRGKLLEVHDRIISSFKSKSTKASHKGAWSKELEDKSFYRKQAKKIGSHVEEIVVHILRQGDGYIDTRKIWGILSLDKKYSKEEINEACNKSISMEAYSYRSVLKMLELNKYVPTENEKHSNLSKETIKASPKYVRSMDEYLQTIN